MSAWLPRLLLHRILVMIPVLLVVSFGVFLLLHLVPGGPEHALLAGRPATPEVLEAIRARFGLDDPLLVQYVDWLGNAVRLDFGRSILTGQPVTEAISNRVWLSAELGLYAFLITVCVGLPLGIWGALRRNSALDQSIVGLSVVGVSAPAFATGIVLIYVFGVALEWFPTFGPGTRGLDRIYHLTLPAIALALGSLALIVKVARAAFIEEIDKDYIAFARARGLSRRDVILRHALRNALVPITTAAGLVFVQVITGAVLVEITFAIPGLGSLLVESVHAVDIPMLQGLVVFIAIFIVVLHLVIDVLYAVIDPRVRFGRVQH
jgi:peptide/nickel transport system permease protein